MQVSDDLRLGPVNLPADDYLSSGNPAPMAAGAGPMGRVYVWDSVPVASGTALIAALQTLAGAGAMVLTPGAGTSRVFAANGVPRIVLDVPRSVTLTSAGNISAVNFTITGYDQYGQRMTQTLAGPNANTVATTKTFKSVESVVASGAVGTNTSVGFNDRLGFPYRLKDLGYIISQKWNGAVEAATPVLGDATAPTAATGDVRGAITVGSAADGVKRLVIVMALQGAQVGPNATRLDLAGQPQA